MKSKKERFIKGFPISNGITMGKAFVLKEEEPDVKPQKIPKGLIKKEIARYKEAINKTRQELITTRQRILELFGKTHTPLADTYLLILNDPILTTDLFRKIQEEEVNAEYILINTLNRVGRQFEKINDQYFRERRFDLFEVGKKILSYLLGLEKKSVKNAPQNSIIVAHNLSPADTVPLKERQIKGLAIEISARSAHVNIIAKDLNLPAVIGLSNILSIVNDDDFLIIDGNKGFVIINPTDETFEKYRKSYQTYIKELEELEKLRDLPAITVDNRRIKLLCNIDTPDDVKYVLSHGGEGIGLFRTEFLYFDREKLPTEEEHYECYKEVAKKILPYPITIRTVDIGGDKLIKFGIRDVFPEPNPALGLRGIRLTLKYPSIFRTQLRGILRASNYGKIKIMLPMVSSVEEIVQAKQILEETKAELREKGIPFDENVEFGVMIETPSAALISDFISKMVDFLSVGTNDLIQYTLAIDRGNENIFFSSDSFHFAIFRLIKQIIDNAHKENKPVGICGELAAEPNLSFLLIGLGFDEFSVAYPRVLNIKKTIRSTIYFEAKQITEEILSAKDKKTIPDYIKDMVKLGGI